MRRKRDESRRQKAIMKALETPKEKRERRLAKKEENLRRQRQKEGWDSEYLVSGRYGVRGLLIT